MSGKVREKLIAEFENHGFVNRGGMGSQVNFTHPQGGPASHDFR